MDDFASWVLVPLQILFVDLLLGADNALVIALACRRLPPNEVRQAATIGVAGAVVIRTLLAFVASALLAAPFVKLIGAATLMVIAMNMAVGEELGEEGHFARPGATLWSAAAIILVADTTMSLDNVVALAAIARGNLFWLVMGVALSLPIIAFGGVMLAELLKRASWLVEFGAALLGWIALEMAVTDAIFGGWLDLNMPALVGIAPALGAAFVVAYGRFAAVRATAPAAAPLPATPAPATAPIPAAAPLPAPPPNPRPVPVRVEPAPAALYDPGGEHDDHHEPPVTVKNREDRIAIIGMLLLALAAGIILMVASYLDSAN
jgi:YjbE family integral membrane protein